MEEKFQELNSALVGLLFTHGKAIGGIGDGETGKGGFPFYGHYLPPLGEVSLVLLNIFSSMSYLYHRATKCRGC